MSVNIDFQLLLDVFVFQITEEMKRELQTQNTGMFAATFTLVDTVSVFFVPSHGFAALPGVFSL